MAQALTVKKWMSQDEKDVINTAFYKAKAVKLVCTLKFALKMKEDPDGDTDQLRKEFIKAHESYSEVNIKHMEMLELQDLEARDSIDRCCVCYRKFLFTLQVTLWLTVFISYGLH